MSASFTPGPWAVFDWVFGGERKIGVTPEHGGKGDVALCSGFDDRRKSDEAVANARLIAAAPELLSALRKLMAAYAACNGEDHPAYLTAEEVVITATEGRS